MKQIAREDIILFLQKSIAEETKLDIEVIDIHQSMGTFGLDSINSIYVLQHLENLVDMELNPLLFWDYPTINSLSSHLHQLMLNPNE